MINVSVNILEFYEVLQFVGFIPIQFGFLVTHVKLHSNIPVVMETAKICKLLQEESYIVLAVAHKAGEGNVVSAVTQGSSNMVFALVFLFCNAIVYVKQV